MKIVDPLANNKSDIHGINSKLKPYLLGTVVFIEYRSGHNNDSFDPREELSFDAKTYQMSLKNPFLKSLSAV